MGSIPSVPDIFVSYINKVRRITNLKKSRLQKKNLNLKLLSRKRSHLRPTNLSYSMKLRKFASLLPQQRSNIIGNKSPRKFFKKISKWTQPRKIKKLSRVLYRSVTPDRVSPTFFKFKTLNTTNRRYHPTPMSYSLQHSLSNGTQSSLSGFLKVPSPEPYTLPLMPFTSLAPAGRLHLLVGTECSSSIALKATFLQSQTSDCRAALSPARIEPLLLNNFSLGLLTSTSPVAIKLSPYSNSSEVIN